MHKRQLTSGSTGIGTVRTFFEKPLKKVANSTNLGEPGVNCIMRFRNYIEDIDFDGAEIESISRNGNTINVIFNDCILFSRHPNSSEYKGKINILAIAFNNVSNEQSKKFIGTGVSEPYSGEKPLETIEILSKEGTYFELGGYVGGEPWYQWSFSADSYEGSY